MKAAAFAILRILGVFLLLWLKTVTVKSQTQNDWWYFGSGAGLHFAQTGAVPDLSSTMYAQEGCASMSTPLGELLFYTNGNEVYDTTHQVMPNGIVGIGVFSISSTQSSLIIRKPNSNHLFYIFTTVQPEGGAYQDTTGFRFSVVDMHLNGGLGDVVDTLRKVRVRLRTQEKVTATRSTAFNGWWVCVTSNDSTQILAFRLTETGLDTVPVISAFTPTFVQNATNTYTGYMRISPNGKFLAANFRANANATGIFSFDNYNGTASLIGDYPNGNINFSPYGMEFSVGSNRLYIGVSTGEIVQYDVHQLPNYASFLGSADTVGKKQTIGRAALQSGPDGKIYIARGSIPYVDVIHRPELTGAEIQLQDSAIFLQDRVSRFGLPNNLLYLLPKISGHCIDDTTWFQAINAAYDSVHWYFNDAGSGITYASGDTVSHVYSDTGLYEVQILGYMGSINDTFIRSIRIYPRAKLQLPEDTTLCFGDSLILDVNQPYASFDWSDGTHGYTTTVVNNATLWVTVNGMCDTLSDTLSAHFATPVEFSLPVDTVICNLDTWLLALSDTFYLDEIKWNTGESTLSVSITKTGNYSVTASNACGTFMDSINVEFYDVPIKLFSNDTTICEDAPIYFSPKVLPNTSYLWSDSSQNTYIRIDSSVQLWLTAMNPCGSQTDSIFVHLVSPDRSSLGADTFVCPGSEVILNAFVPNASYLWNADGSVGAQFQHDSAIVVVDSGLYIVTVTEEPCHFILSRRIRWDEDLCIPCKFETPNVFTPNSDGINDTYSVSNLCNNLTYSVTIFNRWGQVVFKQDHATGSTKWDGAINGSLASEGTYFVLIEFLSPDGKEKFIHATTILMR